MNNKPTTLTFTTVFVSVGSHHGKAILFHSTVWDVIVQPGFSKVEQAESTPSGLSPGQKAHQSC